MFKYRPTKTMVIMSALGASVGAVVLLKEFVGGCEYLGTESLHGKTVIVTGANQGIGKEVVRGLAKRGARVVMACRDLKACEESRKEIVLETLDKHVVCRCLDLASFQSVRDFAKNFNEHEPRLDILINNAGLMSCDPRLITEDGLEMQMGVNHFGHFLLTHLLLDKLRKSAGTTSRIVNVSSAAHKRGAINFDDLNSEKSYDPRSVYAQSKLANVLFTAELARRLADTQIKVCAVHPGVVNTNIVRYMGFTKSYFASVFVSPFLWMFGKQPRQGAQPVLQAALDPDVISGKYYGNCSIEEPSEAALDKDTALRLWKTSERWVQLI